MKRNPLFVALLLLAMNPLPLPADITLFDFTERMSPRDWQIVNDGVMGGRSASRFERTNGVAVFSGTVSLENNGGFASVRSAPGEYDLSGCRAFLLRVRGDGRQYKFTVRTHAAFDGVLYQATFRARAGEWSEHSLPFHSFTPTFRGRVLSEVPPLNPAKIASVGFLISDKQAGPFRLEVAWIKAVGLPNP